MNSDFYKAFEDKFRGTHDLIKTRLQVYLPFIKPLKYIYPEAEVVDLGCGRGEWLELLEENGFLAQGVDLDDGMLAVCRELGLRVQSGEALSYLKSLPDQSLVVITGFHVAEHIQFDVLQALVEESLRVLRPAGLLILETPNPENIVVGTSRFYLDPTHQRPIPPQLLAFLPEYYGFEKIKVLRLQESTELVNSNNLSLLNVLNGVSPDYAVVAQKTAEDELLTLTNKAFEAEYGVTLEQLATTYNQQAGQVETQARQAEAKAQQAEADAQQAEAKAQQAEAKAQQAEAKAQQAEAKAQQAEAKIVNTELMASIAENIAREAKAEISALYRSRSWRFTKPMRVAANRFRILINYFRDSK